VQPEIWRFEVWKSSDQHIITPTISSGSETTIVVDRITFKPPSTNISVIGNTPKAQAQNTRFQRCGSWPAPHPLLSSNS
jgi:hypothetical protein